MVFWNPLDKEDKQRHANSGPESHGPETPIFTLLTRIAARGTVPVFSGLFPLWLRALTFLGRRLSVPGVLCHHLALRLETSGRNNGRTSPRIRNAISSPTHVLLPFLGG